MRHTLEIDDETLDRIIVQDLKWHYENFEQDPGMPFVSIDSGEEAAYVRKMRKALKRVIKFYGGTV